MVDVTVRTGQPEDLEAAVAVYRAASKARRGGRRTSREREELVRRELRRPGLFFVVAEDAGVLIGIASAMPGLADGGTGVAPALRLAA
jgi:hypothetical protein